MFEINLFIVVSLSLCSIQSLAIDVTTAFDSLMWVYALELVAEMQSNELFLRQQQGVSKTYQSVVALVMFSRISTDSDHS